VEFAISPYSRGRRFSLLFALLVSFVFILQSPAQQTTASISGTVKDPTGAVLPQASVTVTDASTGAVDKTVADAAGVYTFPSLPVGTYTISAAQTGFTTANLSGITLQVYQKAVVDIVLHIGGTAQTVTVQGSTSLVDASTASLGRWSTSRPFRTCRSICVRWARWR
jgi:hypothetical protein